MTDKTHYLFSAHEHQDELDRLRLQEQSIDWVSIGRLSTLGLTAGCRCLEAGLGAGSILRWMADTVTPTGSVLGIDLDDRFFGLNTGAGIELVKADLLTVELPRSSYDFIHCRLVLMHLADDARRQLLARFLDALRPGGWLVVLDAAYGYRPVPPESRAQALWYKLADAVVDVTKARSDFTLGARLPALVADAGFSDVSGMGFFGLPCGHNEHWQIMRNAAEVTKRMNMLADVPDVSPADLDELITLTAGHEIATAVPYGMAWARKPL